MTAMEAIEKQLIEQLGASQLVIAKQVGAIVELQSLLAEANTKLKELSEHAENPIQIPE